MLAKKKKLPNKTQLWKWQPPGFQNYIKTLLLPSTSTSSSTWYWQLLSFFTLLIRWNPKCSFRPGQPEAWERMGGKRGKRNCNFIQTVIHFNGVPIRLRSTLCYFSSSSAPVSHYWWWEDCSSPSSLRGKRVARMSKWERNERSGWGGGISCFCRRKRNLNTKIDAEWGGKAVICS